MITKSYFFLIFTLNIILLTTFEGDYAYAGVISSKESAYLVDNASIISGIVKTNNGVPISGAVVSDGYSVVQTDETGHYSFTRNYSSEFVFISLPETYEVPVDEKKIPKLYLRINDNVNYSYDFVLTPFVDGGKADSTHVLIALSDPQVQADYETWRFRNETIQDVIKLKNSYPEGTNFYGVVVGDLVWDEYHRLSEHTTSCSELEFPVFQVIGNHDHDMNISDDFHADHYFKDAYGPTYYSFNRGKIHYVVLDDIEYLGGKAYAHNVTQNQINWLKKDLAFVPEDKTIVMCVHAPLVGSFVLNRGELFDLMGGRRSIQHVISGHHHKNTNYEINSRLIDHTLGAVQGGFWSGNYCPDGTPNGYGVFQAGDQGYDNWYYKSTGYSKDYQFNAYPVNSVDTGEGKLDCIIANVWNYDSKWIVNIYEDGEKHPMQQYSGNDPEMYDFFAEGGDTRPNYPGIDGGTIASRNCGSVATNHLFFYKPTNPDADFVVEITDRFGEVYRKKLLHNMMVATFKETNGDWKYEQDFNTLPSYPNQYIDATGLAKGTFVQGHSPEGWYASTSGNIRPTGNESDSWSYFNYYRINNGSQTDGWLYSFGEGNPSSKTENSLDRSLGSLISYDNRCISFGVLIENNTDQTIRSVGIDYTGKMWRAGDDPLSEQELTFSYKLNPDVIGIRDRKTWIGEVESIIVDSLSFISPSDNTAAQMYTPNTQINGEDAANQAVVKGVINVTLEPGDVILLRWMDNDNRGNDHALSIDNLIVTAFFNPVITSVDDAKQSRYSMYNNGNVLYFSKIPKGDVEVYDIMGNLLYRNKISLNVLHLNSIKKHGIYLVRYGNIIQKILL
ncbi:calcineurin-like phosphoesterase C-terminal domain-containing protein [Sunxiuqinia sp. A32]|uniref:calcineurin-like phosphoesterase C-terminal domain-containing protein n=1 Tax=Sunxiuqinia sp. A32 TaxID=3461496 RepID=UPI0040455E03